MPNVTLAARAATESVFSIVTDSTRVLTYGTTALSELARSGAESASAYREQAATKRFLDQANAEERMLADLALSDIQHSAEISRQLGKDKEKTTAFNEAMESYRSKLAAYRGKPAIQAVA